MMKCILAALLLVAVSAQASSAPLVDQVKLTSLLDLIQARNLTDLKLANFTVLQQPCLVMTNVYCLDVYDPVCGSDGVTYSNSCTMSQNTCRQVTVAYKGACGSIAK